MRIGIISQEYPPTTAKGGIGTQSWLKAHGMAEQGHDVRVISRSLDGNLNHITSGKVEVIRLASPEALSHTEISDWVAYSHAVAVEIQKQHQDRPFDIIDFPEWGCEGFVHFLNQTRWNRIPSVIQLHGPLVMLADRIGWPEVDTEFYRTGTAMEGACLRLADAIYSSSQISAEWCGRAYGLTKDRIPVLHTGIDTEMFRPDPAMRANRPTILFTGKLAENKGIEWLLDAVLHLMSDFPDLQLRIAGHGAGEYVAGLKSKARKWPESVHFLGYLERKQLAAELAAAHIFAAPSRYEGGPGFVYLEAMACGIPVVACKGSGASETIIENETGYLVDPDCRSELVTVLKALLNNPSSAEFMGQRARDHILETADSRDCLRHIEAFYRTVVNGDAEKQVEDR